MTAADTAIGAMVRGLIDYAGLYPPASLDIPSAVRNYRRYRDGKDRDALGRFIADISRGDELMAAAGILSDLRLSAIVAGPSPWNEVSKLLDAGARIESVECKAGTPREIERLAESMPAGIEAYVEVPIEPLQPDLLHAIANTGARVKLRTGGIVAKAFPSSRAVARMLAAVVSSGLTFKATAGLHHPIRSTHPFTYAQGSPTGLMHGFVNLLSAVALLRSGADISEAEGALEEQDAGAWELTPQWLAWGGYKWSPEKLAETRETFAGFGSCSFEEPMRGLEALGWH